jgi:hypothetical protein
MRRTRLLVYPRSVGTRNDEWIALFCFLGAAQLGLIETPPARPDLTSEYPP